MKHTLSPKSLVPKHQLVGRITSIAKTPRGPLLITLAAKLDDQPEICEVVLELKNARLEHAKLIGSTLMGTAKIDGVGKKLCASELESFGIEYDQLAA